MRLLTTHNATVSRGLLRQQHARQAIKESFQELLKFSFCCSYVQQFIKLSCTTYSCRAVKPCATRPKAVDRVLGSTPLPTLPQPSLSGLLLPTWLGCGPVANQPQARQGFGASCPTCNKNPRLTRIRQVPVKVCKEKHPNTTG